MPQQNGSLSSSSNVASALTKAVPVITGTTSPFSRFDHLKRPVKLLPMMLSCTHA